MKHFIVLIIALSIIIVSQVAGRFRPNKFNDTGNSVDSISKLADMRLVLGLGIIAVAYLGQGLTFSAFAAAMIFLSLLYAGVTYRMRSTY